jgi:hypothetical protein
MQPDTPNIQIDDRKKKKNKLLFYLTIHFPFFFFILYSIANFDSIAT